MDSNALFRKALKRGLCNMPLDIEELITTADKTTVSSDTQ